MCSAATRAIFSVSAVAAAMGVPAMVFLGS